MSKHPSVDQLAASMRVSAPEFETLLEQAKQIAEKDNWWSLIIVHNGKPQAVPCDAMWGTAKVVVFKDGTFEAYESEARKTYSARAKAMYVDDDIPDLDPDRLAVLVPRAARFAIEEDVGYGVIVCLTRPRMGGVTHDAVAGMHNLGATHYIVFGDGTYEKYRKTQIDGYRARGEEISERMKTEDSWKLSPYATAVLSQEYRPGGHGDPLPPGTELDIVNDQDGLFLVKPQDAEAAASLDYFWVWKDAVRDVREITPEEPSRPALR